MNKGAKINIQKIFNALDEDTQNSALGTIYRELETQGYIVSMNGSLVTSEGFWGAQYAEIENSLEPINIEISRKGKDTQQFSIEFTDFHEIAIKKYQ